MDTRISTNKLLAILGMFAGVIIIMLVGMFIDLKRAEVGLAPMYALRVAPIEKAIDPPVYVQARLSHYWPPYGGPNCFAFNELAQECVSGTASGEPWEDWINIGLACPSEYSFGTVFVLPGGEEFTCVDRGGMVVTHDGIPWLDLLVEFAPVPYGTVVTVEVRE